MKKSLLFTILMTAVLSFQASMTYATLLNFPVPSNFAECTASPPAEPTLPQDDDFLCADVNEDGFVNVLDIISMVNYIMGGTPSPFNLEAADINADNGINVLDIIALVNIIMQVQGLPCGCVAPVAYEGQTYTTVQVGEQCWFKENLNVGTKINSTYPGRYQQTDNEIIEKYCYNNDLAQCDIYGGLYEWPEAMQYAITEGTQGICPAGWHIPSDDELKILESAVDSQYPVGDPEWDDTGWRGLDAGGNLKEAGTTHWNSPNTGATNENGFTGLPGGYRDGYGYYFMGLGNFGQFWSSSELNVGYTWSRELYYDNTRVHRLDYDMANGFSVRCIKGCWPQPTQANAGLDQLNIPGTSTTLAGNTPTSGTGEWHIMSGTGGTIADTTSPASLFTGLAGNSYSLTWTITTQCGSTEDTVLISFAAGGGIPCPGIPTVTFEGQTYNTVQIGEQCWFKENLNVGTMIISNSPGQLQTDNNIIEKYCNDNDASNCDTYGGLYEWNEAMQYVITESAQGICPAGWHIPTDGEVKILEGNVDSEYPVGDPEWNIEGWRGSDAGGNLKEAGTTHWNSPNMGATNSSGFTGLPAGSHDPSNGSFIYPGSSGSFWSSSQSSTNYAWARSLNYSVAGVGRYHYNKWYGFPVRCLKDDSAS